MSVCKDTRMKPVYATRNSCEDHARATGLSVVLCWCVGCPRYVGNDLGHEFYVWNIMSVEITRLE